MGLLCFLLTVSGVRPSGEVLKAEKFVGRLTGSDFREASRPIKPGTGDLAGDRERRAVFDLMARGRHDRRRAIGTGHDDRLDDRELVDWFRAEELREPARLRRHGNHCRPEIELARLHRLFAGCLRTRPSNTSVSASVMSALLISRA